MTGKEIDSAIALALGWKFDKGLFCALYRFRAWTPPGVESEWRRTNSVAPPNFSSDLNAMREAEELFYGKWDTVKGAEQMMMYSRLLCRHPYPLRATARQRAEAFLETLKAIPQ